MFSHGTNGLVKLFPWENVNNSISFCPKTLDKGKLDDGWPESDQKYSEICNCEDRIAWNIEREIYEDVSKKEDVNLLGAKKKMRLYVKMGRCAERHKRFYTQTLLHTDPFTHKRFYTQAP